jgi:hypothetical protein
MLAVQYFYLSDNNISVCPGSCLKNQLLKRIAFIIQKVKIYFHSPFT